MAGGIVFDGSIQRVPGVYAEYDADGLGTITSAAGNLAVVGKFPSLPQHTPTVFTKPKALRALNPSDLTLALLAKICWNPANDDRIRGIASLTMVNVQGCSAAFKTFLDAAGSPHPSVTFTAKLFGLPGNSVYVALKPSTDTNFIDIFVTGYGKTETAKKVGSGVALKLDSSACPELLVSKSDTATASLFNDAVNVTDGWCNRFTWAWTRHMWKNAGADPLTGAGDVYTFTGHKLPVMGKLYMYAAADSASGNKVKLTVVGLDVNGATVTASAELSHAIAPFSTGDSAVLKSGATEVIFSRIDTMEWSADGSSYATPPVLHGTAFDLTLDQAHGFSSAADFAAYLSPFSSAGWAVNAQSPSLTSIPANQLDGATDTNTMPSGGGTFRANTWAVVQVINATSSMIGAARASGAATSGILPPAPFGGSGTSAGPLVGGTQAGSVADADYIDGLAKIKTKPINVVVAMGTTNVTQASDLTSHIKDAAVAGFYRNGYFGTDTNQTPDEVYDGWTSQTNSRHLSVIAQEPLLANPLTGVKQYFGTEWLAVLLAAMQCGRAIGIPLTNKKPNLLGVRQNWTLGDDDNEVIGKGIYAITEDDTGYKVLRSITSWISDDNPVYEEVSANESGNATVADLNANLKPKIGDPAKIGPRQLEGLVAKILDKQVTAGIITSWDKTTLVIEKVADKYSIDYDFVPVFPFNFAVVHAHATPG